MTELVILRHARAGDAPNDFRRSLAAEGWNQAEAAAKALVESHFHVGRVLCSPALRARETLVPLRSALHIREADVLFDRMLYNVGADTITGLVREHLPAAPLLIVGHNPGLEQFVSWLVGGTVALGTADWVRLRLGRDYEPGCGTVVDSFHDGVRTSLGARTAPAG